MKEKYCYGIGKYYKSDISDPAMNCWRKMLMRCYYQKYLSIRPTYSGASVCDEWLTFENFSKWHKENNVDGWQLDKDLIGNSKVYSPDSCIFVPAWLNTFVVDCGASRGSLPIGVCFDKSKGKYQAQCRDNISKKRGYIGRFESAKDASRAWVDRKASIAYQLKDVMDSIDKRIYVNVVSKIFSQLA